MLSNYAGDAKTGVQIVLRALEEPIRQIAANAGIDGSVIVENIKNSQEARLWLSTRSRVSMWT